MKSYNSSMLHLLVVLSCLQLISSFSLTYDISSQHRYAVATPLTMASTTQTVEIPSTSLAIQLRHQLFLGDLKTSTHDLTGLKLWPTASQPMLAVLGKRYKDTQPLQILELGSGCGLLGIGLAAMGHTIVMTDADVDFSGDTTTSSTLKWLQSNVDLNFNVIGERVTVKPLLWGDEKDMKKILQDFDLIVGSELLYSNEKSFPALIETMSRFAGPSTSVLLGYKIRGLGEGKFFDIADEKFEMSFKSIGRKSDKIQLAELRRRLPQ
mmetsp:Transcript_30126/g.54501  ORF Transcript_30126/g.54501 Transcript_30126/m.54501 type:complete len:266 (-) Transcript_30126:110-907(-)